MNSVRLRLLAMALVPLIVLMPLLLLLGMTRWTSDYDKVLIANVESDLRIAEQYLARLMADAGTDLTALAASAEFARAMAAGPAARDRFLAASRSALGFDFLYFHPEDAGADTARRWPVIDSALAGTAATEIDIFSGQTLRGLDAALAEQARVELIPTEAAVPTARTIEDRGMVIHAASPVRPTPDTPTSPPGLSTPPAPSPGALVGGMLLNRNLQFIDTINALVYLNAVTGGDRQGTATLFLEDVRVSTNVRLFEDVRALGTRVSAAVRAAVLDDGRTWLDRAFVVNDWYVSGYMPITDSFGDRVGMLYVGFLEAPFAAAKRAAFWWMLAAFLAVLALSAPLFLWLAKGIFAPLEAMTRTMSRVERGDLSARNGDLRASGEIRAVAAHLDSLLEQVQDRDRELRDWGNHLNTRVDQRTAELREANKKLEEATQQLVMSEKLAAIGEITAGVAHEINNPVAVIQGNVDVIRDTLGRDSAPIRTELTLIDRQISRISAIVGKLLQFARPGDYGGNAAAVSVATVVEDCLTLVGYVTAQKDIEIRTDLTGDSGGPLPDVRIDPGELQQVVVNLIVNAAHAMGSQGTLTIRAEAEARGPRPGTCLRVADTGPGIAPERLAHVFDPFFTTRPGEGTGLGLSISQTIIQRAGGLITAANQPTGGAVFSIWLPAADADPDLSPS